MIFSLEALNAKHGDALILHYGPSDAPKFIVIDGGPPTVYENALKPRLSSLRSRWFPNGPLEIELAMVSHIDEDHVTGIVNWTNDLVRQKKSTGTLDADILCLWHNAFDDIIGNDQDGLVASLSDRFSAGTANLPVSRSATPCAYALLASVAQGRDLRDNASSLNILLNEKFTRVVMAGKTGKKVIKWGDGLQLTVVGPSEARLRALQEEWDKKLKTLRKKKATPAQLDAALAAYVDKSVYNLSSIVVLAECDGKKMLLTGDARGDEVLGGLEDAGFLPQGGQLQLDLLKLPHHGSSRNVDKDFFERLPAEHYVISADGKYGNPDNATLTLLSKARGTAAYTIHLTNKTGKEGLGPRLAKFFAAEKKAKKKYYVDFRVDTQPSLRVDLAEEVNY